MCPADSRCKKRKICDNSPSTECVSSSSFSSQFRFFQVDEQWQRHWCSQLGLEFYAISYQGAKGSSSTVLTAPDMRTGQSHDGRW